MANTDDKPRFNALDFIVAAENGELDEEAMIEGVQALVDNGMIYRLQGGWQRTAQGFIDRGLVTLRQ